MKKIDPNDIDFGGPATYRIVVRGSLESRWRDRMAGLETETVDEKDGVILTSLVGRIHDQAELKGVLDTLYGLHLPILQVETV